MILRPFVLVCLGCILAMPLRALPLASDPQEQAQFLAGIELPKGSILRHLQRSPEYLAHQQKLRGEWEFCRQVRYDTMQAWGRSHLSPYPSTRGILRYLFGGPDFLNAYAFFPDTRVMVLGGLEPVGEVPPPEALDPSALGTALHALDEALHTSLYCGYFITSEMKPQLVQGSFQGVLPVLYTELALTGNSILSVQMVRPFGSPGVEIIYQRPGGPQQTLYYFKADLSNGKECLNFLRWLDDLGPGASYLKAASYLLPLEWFSETRNFLLKSSELILQDDSGIPFRDFRPDAWHLELYGVYTDPLPVFHLHREAELDEGYHSEHYIGSLPFGVGYHVNANDANLLLAIRNNGQPYFAPTAASAVSALPAMMPNPTPVTIRKALPVPVRKAIPVRTPKPKNTPNPPLVKPIPILTPAPTPVTTPIPAISSTPAPTDTPSASAELFMPLPEPQEESQPIPAATAPATVPETPNGKPID